MEGSLQRHQAETEIHVARNFPRQKQRGGRQAVEDEAGEKQVEERDAVVTSQRSKTRRERGERRRGC